MACRLQGQVTVQALAAQVAGGAVAAPVALDAVVAGQGLMAHQVEHAQLVGQGPGLALVYPHEGRVQDELLLHALIERYVQAFDERVAAVGVTAVVGLGHAGDDVVDAALARIDGGNGQEEQVAARHESVGQTALGLPFIHVDGSIGQGVAAQLGDKADVHRVPMHLGLMGYPAGALHLGRMLLAVAEGERPHLAEALLGPIQAGGGVLPPTEYDQSLFLIDGLHGCEKIS